ncbi:hypothetical protein BG004_001350, partial [Podila humilis]
MATRRYQESRQLIATKNVMKEAFVAKLKPHVARNGQSLAHIMTLKTPILSAIDGIVQVALSENTSHGVSSIEGYNHLLTNTGGIAAALEHSEANVLNSSTAPATKHDGGSSHDVHTNDGLLTVPGGLKPLLLGAVPAVLMLPTDRPRSYDGPFVGALYSVSLEDPILSQLLRLVHDLRSDLATAVLVAWTIVLSRLSGQETINLGVGGSVNTRSTMNPSNLVVDFSGEPDTSELFTRVSQSLKSSRDESITFFQASFYAHADGLARALKDGVSMNCFLELHLLLDSTNVYLDIRYAVELYNKATIERYAGYLNAVLVNMMANSTLPAATFDILSTAEKKLLFETWNDTGPGQKVPDAVAIIHGEKKLTYLELNSLANCLARKISKAGVVPGDYVALLFERSIELVVAELAVLKAGAAYVPIDTAAPGERQAFIVLDTGSKLLLTNDSIHVPDQIQAPAIRFKADLKDIRYEP